MLKLRIVKRSIRLEKDLSSIQNVGSCSSLASCLTSWQFATEDWFEAEVMLFLLWIEPEAEAIWEIDAETDNLIHFVLSPTDDGDDELMMMMMISQALWRI
ncbi:hypothetical protein L6452_37093 [Arctium lappa]|uniref:Uncharacterized protein n=1 Tax=Arctium lappa TaxID=4217 RepID=A0ACB8Y1B2_ARCLA|nr:hypothetical protein L6452_37093 [Arctium lappa]